MKSSFYLSLVLFSASLCAQHDFRQESSKHHHCLVVGLIVDSEGRPIEGAGLAWGSWESITGLDARKKPVATSNKEGRLSARLAAEPGKPYTALLSAPGKVSMVFPFVDTRFEEFDGRKLDGKKLGGDIRRVNLGTTILMEGVDIPGTVRDSTGKELAGARITATDVFDSFLYERSEDNVQLISLATSDDRGRFVLVGVPKRGSTVRISAEGYHSWQRKLVNSGTPLVAELSRGGTISGRVVDSRGSALSDAQVAVYYEYQDRPDQRSTDKDGRFRINLSAPGRFRVRFSARIDGAFLRIHGWSPVFKGPKDNILLQLHERGEGKTYGHAAAKRVGGSFRVKAMDAGGRPIRRFKAVSVWLDSDTWELNPGHLERRFNSSARESNANGEVVLPGPGRLSGIGRVLVKARGFAPKVIEDIDLEEHTNKQELAVRLEPGSTLEGMVVDSRSRKPVADARVFATDNPFVIREYDPPPLRTARANQPGHVVTDKGGCFRIEGLGEGSYTLYASHPERPDADPIRVTTEKGKAKTGVRLLISPGAAILGRLIGSKTQLGWQVRVRKQAEEGRSYRGPVYVDPGRTSELVPLDARGAFSIQGLAKANYSLSLVMPHGCGSVEVPIGPLRLRSRDLKREFDISEDLPGRVTGRVELKGAALPFARMVLLARRSGERWRNYFGSKTVLSLDGRFNLPLREGRYYLSVVDLATDLVLCQHHEAIRIRSTKTSHVDLLAELTTVQVKLIPVKEGAQMVVNRLEVRLEHPSPVAGNDAGLGRVVFGDSSGDHGTGVPVRRGQTDLMLFLPAVRTKLFVRSSAHNLDPSKSRRGFPALGTAELIPELGRMKRVEIHVGDPHVESVSTR